MPEQIRGDQSKIQREGILEEDSILPLLPATSLSYFEDAQSSNKLYLRATSIRSCLEYIVDTVFVQLVDFNKDCTSKQWEQKNLYKKLMILESFFPSDINVKIHSIRQLGNKGAHQKGHDCLTTQDVNKTLKDLSRICEWTILSYFKKHGFNHDSWMPTIFSTLQPVYRIRILMDLFLSLKIDKDELVKYQDKVQKKMEKIYSGDIMPDFNYIPSQKEKELSSILLIIDKLAMSFLKNKEYDTSVNFIEKCCNDGIINEQFKTEMIEKLNSLWKEIDSLPIAQDREDTIFNFERVMKAVKKEEESLFITMFTAVISQDTF